MDSLSNGLMLKLRNARHTLKLKINLISVGQLVDGGMKTTFDDDICKITKGVMVMAHSKKEDTIYMISSSRASISVASSKLDVRVWHWRLEHMSEKRMKVILSKDKLSVLRSIDLDFCKDCVTGRSGESVSQRRKRL